METRGTILVVDDTPDIATLLRAVLTEAGYRVLVAPTAETGLQVLAAFRVGLVLADAVPPASDCAGDPWADLDRLADAAGGSPLLLCAPGGAGDYADHAAHGFVACLPKPFDLDDLLATVGRLLPVGGPHQPVAHGSAPAHEG